MEARFAFVLSNHLQDAEEEAVCWKPAERSKYRRDWSAMVFGHQELVLSLFLGKS